MQDYSGFYFNVEGKYEDLVYYISPLPEQKLYMIRKMDRFVDTNKILKSIETGFNGYDYEVYGVDGISDYYSNNKYYDYDIRTYDKDSIREKYEYIQTNSEIKLLKIKIYL